MAKRMMVGHSLMPTCLLLSETTVACTCMEGMMLTKSGSPMFVKEDLRRYVCKQN